MSSDANRAGDARQELTQDEKTALVAQLHYDRADVARISSAAAAAMDVVIALVVAVVEKADGNTKLDGA